jgi:hypothetical protein
MADPDRIIFIAANIDEANAIDEAAPPPYPDTGGERVWYTVPDGCYDDPQRRVYRPGAKRDQYFDYVEFWRGWPFIQYTLQKVDSADFVLIWNQFAAASTLDGWVWFARYNAQTRSYKCKKGIMEMPTFDPDTGGGLYRNVMLGFGAIWYQDYELELS